jgi:hypothetical protein
MALMGKVQRGQPLTADMINNIIDSIRECQLQSVVGGIFKRGVGGTTITLKAGQQQQQQEALCPFTPTISTTTAGKTITFSAGTINGILPTNMFTSFPITANVLNYYYLTCASDGKVVIGAEIDYGTSTPPYYIGTPDSAPQAFSRLIAVVITSGIAVKTIACDNLTARVVATVQEDNVTYVAGKRNFIQYYGWA